MVMYFFQFSFFYFSYGLHKIYQPLFFYNIRRHKIGNYLVIAIIKK